MNVGLRNAVLSALALPFFAQGALAQTEEELRQAFSGAWFAFEDSYSDGNGPCRIYLSNESVSDDGTLLLKGATEGCAAPLTEEISWRVESGKILLETSSGQQVAALGGNPQRLSGDYVRPPNALVLERQSGSGAKADLTAAIKLHGCYYLGFTQDCAEPSATEAPAFEDGLARIKVLVNLNARSQPRRDAQVIGTIPAESEVTVNACLTTSDGIWCRAQFNEANGWMAKSAMRAGEWPVITFVNAPMAEQTDD
ncbi:AprI/Inh family metalloprotease inhibitor [Roseovarius sp. SYSU LYC5161]|uniref:AprI/Inh family metalloprotease inhibitor n=1 Tax=Roseovarius halophilus (ex Wu et al. 2025) TaxID=3376060 RepID=UPI0028727826|nr:AprI/Inh family metalloprotease inhibitor [Roseovarius sp.]